VRRRSRLFVQTGVACEDRASAQGNPQQAWRFHATGAAARHDSRLNRIQKSQCGFDAWRDWRILSVPWPVFARADLEVSL
jgi:hypothetical protein